MKVIIVHRLSAIYYADKTAFMQEKERIEFGTREERMQNPYGYDKN